MNRTTLLAATFLLTAGGLLFEVALTRMLSLVHYSGLVFAILSAALLGVALGAATAALSPALREPRRLADWAALAALSALLCVVAVNQLSHLPLQFLQLLLAAVPFYFSGLALSSLFSSWPGQSHRLYWADLMGAGCGTLLALPLLSWLDATGATLAGGVIIAVSALLFRPGARFAQASLLLVAGALVLSQASDLLEPDLASLANPKPLSQELQAGAETVATASSAFTRSDLIRRPDGSHYLFADAAAGSLVPLSDDARLRNDIGYLPFSAFAPESVFLLGPGGGLDAALARLAGASQIVAAELNGAGLDLVFEVSPSAYANTVVLHDEGRSVLRHLEREFDLIFLSHVITQTSDLRGFALSEASTYTTEAFRDYLNHLSNAGALAIKLYDELTLSRAFFTAWRALEAEGAGQPDLHLFAALDTSASQPLPLLLVTREPLDRDAAVALAREAERLGHALLFVPHLLHNPPLDRLAGGDASLDALVAEAAAGGIDLKPVSDTAPFFFQFETGLPQVIRPAAWVAVVLAVAASLLFALRRRRPAYWPAAPVTFAALGAGFMIVELGLIQRSQLFLGHPVLSLSLVLATVLLAGGFGSLLGGRLRRPLFWGPLLTVVLLACWHLLWPLLNQMFQGSSLPLRMLVTVFSIVPVALFMGMQLPAGIRRLSGESGRIAAAWAVNGLWSVLGSIFTVAVALLFDYQAALLAGILCYLLVLLSAVTGPEPA